MACIRPCPCIGLSAYIVCRQGASKPVSHISRTITILNGFLGSLNSFAKSRRCFLLPMCFCHSGPSSALPVITTLSVCVSHSGRSLISAL